MRFNFTGEIDANKLSDKVPYVRSLKTDKGKKGTGINLVCIAKKNNRAFMESVGFEQDEIKSKDTDNKDIEISWEDREDEDIIKSVASYRKHVISLDGERKEFIADKDFCDYIVEHIDDIKGKRCTVTGQIRKNFYNGKVSDRFQIQNIYEIDEDNDKKKNGLSVTAEFYWTKDSIDTSDFKEEKKIRINGYTSEYISKKEGNKFVPLTIILNCSKVDFENESHVAKLGFRLEQLGLELEDDKIKNNIKAKNVMKNMITLSYNNGAEEVEFDESQLTATQKSKIKLGLATVDDFKPKGAIFGNRIVEYRITDFPCTGNYSDGLVKDDMTASELEDEVYELPKEEKLEDAMEDEEEEKKSSDDDDDDDEDLFD